MSADSVDESAVARFTRQRRVWIALSAVLVLSGSIASLVAAKAQSHKHANRMHQEFRAASADVAATLAVAIEREQDLIVGAGAVVAGERGTADTRFAAWARRQLASGRYPEILGLGDPVIVPSTRLSALAVSEQRARDGSRAAKGTLSVHPLGKRPFYCLAGGYVTTSPQSPYPAGYDWCDGPLRGELLAARDRGSNAYVPVGTAGGTGLTVLTPVYRGSPPASVAARRSSLLGWAVASVATQSVLVRALAGHAAIGVTLSYGAPGSDVAFHRGPVPTRADSLAIDLHNGWSVRTFTAAAPSGLFVDLPAAAMLLGGIAFSLLLGALVFVLGTGRTRALRLVSIKTAELRHQALHDALTGLPNRSLIADRVERLLARSRRTGHPGAMLFIDIDDFKEINDTLGHDAGDQLLKGVSARLTKSLREVDTIGRLGGDEFLVLIDGESNAAPEFVAERVISILRDPFLLDVSDSPITITASVGVAAAMPDTANELMRDADVALYQAKAAGKNRFSMFAAGDGCSAGRVWPQSAEG